MRWKLASRIAATAETGDIAAIAREVENLGYESFFIPEHPRHTHQLRNAGPGGGKLPEHYGRWMDPLVLLSVAAAVTRRVKLGTGICLLPEREPIITAKAIATLDVVSGGRVVLGVGGGWLREETEALGTKFGQRWKRLRETVEAMRKLWTEAEPSYHGELVHFPPVRSRAQAAPESRVRRSCWARADPRRSNASCPLMTVGRRWSAVPQPSKATLPHCISLHGNVGAIPRACSSTPSSPPARTASRWRNLKLYREAGADRVILFSQRDAIKMAAGRALEVIKRVAVTVERAQHV